MASARSRIRSIKPEIVESETLGRVSHGARLLFVLLFTRADDAGRLAGSARLLASTLYPFDDGTGAAGLVDGARVDGWLDELAAQGNIIRYQAEGRDWIALPEWKQHQKVDHPTPSKIPAPPSREDSRGLASVRDDDTVETVSVSDTSRISSANQVLANPREDSREVATAREGSRNLAPDLDLDLDLDLGSGSGAGSGALAAPAGVTLPAPVVVPRVRRQPSPALTYGLQHADCVAAGFCGWMCLPVELVEECANRIAGLSSADCDPASVARRDEARAAVLARFVAVMGEWKAARRAPTGKKWDFWRERFTEWQGDTSSPARGFDPLAGVKAALAASGAAQ